MKLWIYLLSGTALTNWFYFSDKTNSITILISVITAIILIIFLIKIYTLYRKQAIQTKINKLKLEEEKEKKVKRMEEKTNGKEHNINEETKSEEKE